MANQTQQQLNGYQLNEARGRAKFADLMKNTSTTLEFTKDNYNHLDAFFTSTVSGTTYGVEIKNRSPKDERYSTYIYEKIKYDEMVKKQTNKDTYECWMVYFFGEHSYIFKWSTIQKLIDKNKIQLTQKWLPDSTVNFTKNVLKPCYLLPKEYAWKFEHTDDKWKVINKPNQIK